MRDEFDQPDMWCPVIDQNLIWRFWQGDYVVYSSLSGETLKLDVVSGKVLDRIIEQPNSAKAITSEVANFLHVPDDAQLEAAVSNILTLLEDAGLIELRA